MVGRAEGVSLGYYDVGRVFPRKRVSPPGQLPALVVRPYDRTSAFSQAGDSGNLVWTMPEGANRDVLALGIVVEDIQWVSADDKNIWGYATFCEPCKRVEEVLGVEFAE